MRPDVFEITWENVKGDYWRLYVGVKNRNNFSLLIGELHDGRWWDIARKTGGEFPNIEVGKKYLLNSVSETFEELVKLLKAANP